jgi:hypothetical protein
MDWYRNVTSKVMSRYVVVRGVGGGVVNKVKGDLRRKRRGENFTQEYAAVLDPSHPHSLLLRVLHQHFTEHLEQQLHNLRQYTTDQHQQLLILQFVGNSLPPELSGKKHVEM